MLIMNLLSWHIRFKSNEKYSVLLNNVTNPEVKNSKLQRRVIHTFEGGM